MWGLLSAFLEWFILKQIYDLLLQISSTADVLVLCAEIIISSFEMSASIPGGHSYSGCLLQMALSGGFFLGSWWFHWKLLCLWIIFGWLFFSYGNFSVILAPQTKLYSPILYQHREKIVKVDIFRSLADKTKTIHMIHNSRCK